ncbi:hypothetical protein [Streptomyces sp. NPDC059071]|uniref:hypothetical protein n=1 Tax=unclassified Streptomyces TaxID=2593676 RepID=UPI0036614BF4
MDDCNNDPARPDSPPRRLDLDKQSKGVRARLRKWVRRHEHGVQKAFWQGASYQLGSGAVGLLILWAQGRF